jgi:hypothetical protein
MPIATGVVALLIFLLPMRLDGQGAMSPDPLVGCYRIELGEWIPKDHPERERPVEPPGAFRLLADIGTERLERGRALVRPLLRAQDGGGAYWERVGPDSLRIAWSTLLWGTQLQMQIEGESLHGVVTSWTDVIYVNADGKPLPNLRAEAVAHRVRCPRELRE